MRKNGVRGGTQSWRCSIKHNEWQKQAYPQKAAVHNYRCVRNTMRRRMGMKLERIQQLEAYIAEEDLRGDAERSHHKGHQDID